MLYVVATPIGNLKEITFRAVEVLKNVDYILCEDTRTSAVLLKEYNISKPLFSYHKFNEREQLAGIVSDLKKGRDIALISDAGMPTISDPGQMLINSLISEGLEYTVISGATAFVNAFVISGFSAPFTFVGFLPNKPSERKELLKRVKDYDTALIFYVSPHDLQKTLNELFLMLGERNICLVRELTKKFESAWFSTLEKGYDGVEKGEFVLVVDKPQINDNPLLALSVEAHIEFYMGLGYKKPDAIEMVAKERGMKKNEVYKQSFNLPVER